MLFLVVSSDGVMMVPYGAGGTVHVADIVANAGMIIQPPTYDALSNHLTSDQAQAMCNALGMKVSTANHDKRSGVANHWAKIVKHAIQMFNEGKLNFDQHAGLAKLVAFVMPDGSLRPKVLHSGDVMTMDTINAIPAEALTLEQASTLTNAELIDFIEKIGGSVVGLKSKSKKVLAEKAVEAFRSYMPVRQVVVEAKDHPTLDHPTHGYEKLKMHATVNGDVKACHVFMQNGHLMASTHFGSYVVAEPNDVMDWMLHHNHIMLSREDAKDECGSDAERDTNSSVEDCANSSYVSAPVVNSEVSGGADGRVLMLAFTPQGFKAFAIPNGCIVDLMPPIQQRVLMDYDISHDDNAIKQLLDRMPMTKLMQMWHSLGVQGFGDGMSRDDLVKAMLEFIEKFRNSRALSSTRLQPPQQQTSQEFQFFSGGGYKLGAFESCNINEKPEDYKGALSIFFDNDGKKIAFTFFYDLHSKVQDVYDALVKLGLEVGDDKPYKLAWPGDGITLGSTLHGWEPVFATLHEVKKVVITTSIKGGGFRNPKVVKKLMSKEERLQTAKVEASKIKSTGGKIDFVATADKVLSDFFTLAETSPADAIEEAVKKLSEEEITFCLEAVSGNCGGTTTFKLCHLSRHIFGESIHKVIDLNASTTAIVETCRLTMEMAYDKGVEDGSVSMPWIRQILNDYRNRRIGAREATDVEL
eukprot:symbB.v1.2.005538.t1/scaffold308.1/size235111/1